MEPMIPLTYVLPALRELECRGHHREALYERAEIRAPHVAENALPLSQFTRLYGVTMRLLEGETSRRSDRSVQPKEITDLLCLSVISCPTLEDAIDRIATYNRILESKGGTIEVVRHDNTAELVIDSRRQHSDTAGLLVDLSAMAFYLQLFSCLIRKPIRLLGASVKYAPPHEPILATTLLGVPLAYRAPRNRMLISSSFLTQPIVQSEHEMTRVLDLLPFPFSTFEPGVAYLDPRDQIRIQLLKSLRNGDRLPSSLQISRSLSVSPATLRRRLQELGASYARIRASCQREWAEYLLTATRTPIQVISAQLGFSDDRAFRRAFRKWTGQCPMQFRAQAEI
ncbi:MAG: hypothetical protein CMLOHMNK_02293 [Steroidobacteraceae bacterium]|nr:hypothetical protein [Steroidobacteraceae bacterium]